MTRKLSEKPDILRLCRSAPPAIEAAALLPAAAFAQSTASTVTTAARVAPSDGGVTRAPFLGPSISSAEAQANAGPLDSAAQKGLLANWGPRRKLADEGIALSARWVMEPAVNARGYKGAGFNIVSSVNVNAVLDLGKLGVVDNGKLQIVVTDRLGNGTNVAHTGSYVQNQAFYGQGKNVRFNEIDYEQAFLGNRLSFKGGFYPMGNDFGKLPYTCNFTNNGNCGHPLGPIYSSGWRDDPTGQWGGRLKWTDRSGWYLQAGVYDVNPMRNKPGHGFDLGFGDTIGAYFPVEVGYNWGKTPADYAGTVRIGGYFDTSRATDLSVTTGHTVRGRSGLLVQAAQQIWKPHPNTVRGVAVFAVFTLADCKTGLMRTFYEAGSSWRGPFASRPNDILSISWMEANINSLVRERERLASKDVQTREQMWEVNYGAQIRPWLLVRPGLQYLIRPGAYASRPSTVVLVGHIQGTF